MQSGNVVLAKKRMQHRHFQKIEHAKTAMKVSPFLTMTVPARSSENVVLVKKRTQHRHFQKIEHAKIVLKESLFQTMTVPARMSAPVVRGRASKSTQMDTQTQL